MSGSVRSVKVDNAVTRTSVVSVAASGTTVVVNGMVAMFVAVDVIVQIAFPTTAGPLKEGSGALTLGSGALTEGKGALTEINGALTEGNGALTLGSGALTEGNDVSTLGSGALRLGNGAVTEGNGALTDGKVESRDGSEVLIEGSGALTDGKVGSTEGSGALTEGRGALTTGSELARAGSDVSTDGKGALSDGMTEGTGATTDGDGTRLLVRPTLGVLDTMGRLEVFGIASTPPSTGLETEPITPGTADGLLTTPFPLFTPPAEVCRPRLVAAPTVVVETMVTKLTMGASELPMDGALISEDEEADFGMSELALFSGSPRLSSPGERFDLPLTSLPRRRPVPASFRGSADTSAAK